MPTALRHDKRNLSLPASPDNHALKSKEEHLRRWYEATPAMLHLIDMSGNLIMVSNMWLVKLGYSRDEVLGRPINDFLTLESTIRSDTRVLPEFLEEGSCEAIDFQMVCRAGAILDVLISATLERDENGTAVCILGVIEDISLRLKAERELAEERLRLSNLIEGTHAATLEWNLQTGEVRCNGRWAIMIGLDLNDFESSSMQAWRDRTHPEDLNRYEEVLWRHCTGATDRCECELRMRHRDGGWVWVLERGAVMSWTADGKPEWLFATRLDITERKQQEDALRKSEVFLERTGTLAGIGGWEVDLATNEIYWSAETYRIHGVEPSYKPVLEAAIAFYAPEARPIITAAYERAVAGSGGYDLELPFVRQGGERIWVRAVGTAILENGKPVRLTGAFQDITARVSERLALQKANDRVLLATDSGGIGIWEWDIATDAVTWDPWMFRLYGIGSEDKREIREIWRQGLHPDDAQAVKQLMRKSIEGVHSFDFDFRAVWPDGTIHYQRCCGRVMQPDKSGTLLALGANWDVTEAYRLNADLAEQHELLRVTLRSIGDAVMTTDASGRVTWLNPVAERMTGWSVSDALGICSSIIFHVVNEESRKEASDPIARCLSEDSQRSPKGHSVLIGRDGSEYGIEDSTAPIRGNRGEILGAVLVFHDVTEQRRLAKEISHRASHDLLTGLPNRSEFELRLRTLLQRTQEEDGLSVMLFIDLDQFKIVNDSCGHAQGDQLLCQVTKLLASVVRANDTLARLGGDEFAVILDSCPVSQALGIAQTICDRMEEFRFVHDEHRFRIGASIGLVPLDSRWTTTAAILQAADTCCYAAKEEGRNRVHLWSETDEVVLSRNGQTRWAARLEDAFETDAFKLFAQKYVRLLEDAQGIHAEVLLRMVDVDGTIIPPGAFLPAAERFHMVSRIDRWVLSEVIQWMETRPSLDFIECLNVNLSGQSVGDRAFHRWAVEKLSGVTPQICQKLCLEITETAAVTNLADAALFIEAMHGLNVRVALDDFGAGSSWFGYLSKIPVNFLKIDGQFIRNLVGNPLNEAAVRCFTDVARALKIETVAEFVDDQAVLEQLRTMGVNFAQGYLFHGPEPIDDLMVTAQPPDTLSQTPDRRWTTKEIPEHPIG